MVFVLKRTPVLQLFGQFEDGVIALRGDGLPAVCFLARKAPLCGVHSRGPSGVWSLGPDRPRWFQHRGARERKTVGLHGLSGIQRLVAFAIA
jgi:hypothetical protein